MIGVKQGGAEKINSILEQSLSHFIDDYSFTHVYSHFKKLKCQYFQNIGRGANLYQKQIFLSEIFLLLILVLILSLTDALNQIIFLC